jgi:carbon-monoxide dehydrogenase large subunit
VSSILGTRVVRREDPALLRGEGTYVENLRLDRPLYLSYARSIMAHAKVAGLDLDDAKTAPGVVGVFSFADIGDVGEGGYAPNVLPMLPAEMRRPFLADDTVRYVGQPVVAVLAESQAEAVDAAELVGIDYEPLPVVVDPEKALDDEVVLFPDHGTNKVIRFDTETTADFDDCEVVVSERIVNQRLTAAPIEVRSGAAWWTDDGRLVHYSACQGAHPTRDLLAKIFGLDNEQVRVVVPDVGGGFGAKSRTYPEELVIGHFARALGRPVKWTETRSENVAGMPQGRGQIQYAKIGGTRDGQITAYQLDAVQDVGAFPVIGAVLARMTQRMLTGTYHLTNVGFTSVAAVTNTVSITAYRGAGRPEATVAIERMIERFADEIGMDPAEVRFKNLVPRFTEPYVTGAGTSYDVGDYPKALRLALDAIGYDELRAEQAARRQRAANGDGSEPLLGIGIGSYVEITAGAPGSEFGSIELQPTGRVRVVSGSTPYGQGHDTTWSMLVADRTGISPDLIDVVHGDTDQVARGGLTVGSRSVQIGGSAIAAATTKLIERARNAAANRLEAAPGDVVLDSERGAFHVAGTPAVSVDWAELASTIGTESAAGAGAGAGDGWLEFEDFTPEAPTFPSGAHVAVVEVDPETGGTTLLRLVGADDAGTILNPLLAEGQVHGGMAQGVAQALLEEIRYDDDGNLVTANFMDYPVISSAELPSFEVIHVETPTWVNELGAKGIGESGTIGAIPAAYNAVIDAVSHLGVHHLETPLTPEKVWSAVQAATRSFDA